MKAQSVGSAMRAIAYAIACGRIDSTKGLFIVSRSGLAKLLGSNRKGFQYLYDLTVKARKSPKLRKTNTHVLDKTVNVDDSNDYTRYL